MSGFEQAGMIRDLALAENATNPLKTTYCRKCGRRIRANLSEDPEPKCTGCGGKWL